MGIEKRILGETSHDERKMNRNFKLIRALGICFIENNVRDQVANDTRYRHAEAPNFYNFFYSTYICREKYFISYGRLKILLRIFSAQEILLMKLVIVNDTHKRKKIKGLDLRFFPAFHAERGTYRISGGFYYIRLIDQNNNSHMAGHAFARKVRPSFNI